MMISMSWNCSACELFRAHLVTRIMAKHKAGSSAQQPLETSAPVLEEDELSAGPTAPPPAEASQQTHSEDKQELERQRLQAQASSPNDNDADEVVSGPATQQPHAGPSAPTLNEVELAQTSHDHDNENLPVYER